ncbi:MAG: polyribonucleotide nucleotidyltransferase [Legionellales bacterium RIFCSPHIGHO2_12_FULL_37_14]|nr:MAG: polyribonucleotide nucleotidyltransferase [Legionellales bacterium RIFCSPHIGHO2_12_FULL_37_14]
MSIKKEVKFGKHTIVFETGEIARQADGAVMINVDGTQVLVTAVRSKSQVNNSFFPLTVNYQEKFYAAGRIPGGFNRREGRPSENETLISRLIDRPIRPLFPKEFCQEVQVVATVLSLNPEVSSDIVAMIGASAALAISGLPFRGPIGACRVGYKDGVYLLNPSAAELKESLLDLVVAGTKAKDTILMVESEAKELSEEIMLGAVMFGHEMMKPVIEAIESLQKEVGKEEISWASPAIPAELETKVQKVAEPLVKKAYSVKEKVEREKDLLAMRNEIVAQLGQENEAYTAELVEDFLGKVEKQVVRKRILAGEPRIDGRDHKTVRPINIKTKYLERAHGSAVFTRGETQAIVVVTLGNERDSQILDNLSGESRDRFMLHYNFPPYSVGEVGMMGSPKRREIGHGKLARRAITAVLPDQKAFPYVIRVVSEITESNGSSSMASVCGSSLALMDAGVPVSAPVAGVAMGLIKEADDYAVLTDILGDEDHLGDMDFKVAGTKNGVTALQMDIKITGITKEIMEEALEQAKNARMHILGIMEKSISTPREELSSHAPRITTMKISEDKIRTVIGKGGVTIKGLIESTGVQIDIDDSGKIQLFSPNQDALEEAKKQIKQLVAEVEVGQTYEGKVTKIVDFGAFINLLPGKDGLLHISQICSDRTQNVESVLHEGETIRVYVAGIDKQGRVKLEWKDKPAAAPKAELGNEAKEEINEADNIEKE